MELIASYLWKKIFEVGMHIVAVEDIVHPTDYGEQLIKKDSRAKIVSMSRKSTSFNLLLDDGTELLDVSPYHFAELTDLSHQDAPGVVRTFFGHHSGPTQRVFQFDIKMPHVSIPRSAENVLSDEEVSSIYHQRVEDALRDFIGGQDYSPLRHFPWIGDKHVEGSGGGYLMLKTNAYQLAEYERVSDDYGQDLSHLPANYHEAKMVKTEIEDAIKEIIELAYDLEFIQSIIKAQKTSLVKMFESESFWEEESSDSILAFI